MSTGFFKVHSAKQPPFAFFASFFTSAGEASESIYKKERKPLQPLSTVPFKTEPRKKKSYSILHFAFLKDIFIMCAYRATWVKSQKPTPSAK